MTLPNDAFLPVEGSDEDEVRNDSESRRIRRLCVKFDDIVLCPLDWETRKGYTPNEQSEMAFNNRELLKMDVPWFSKDFTFDDAQKIKERFAGLRVYYKGEEVKL